MTKENLSKDITMNNFYLKIIGANNFVCEIDF